MLITVICKAHKKKWLDNLVENFEKQSYQEKEFVLILNGELENYTVPDNYIIFRSNSSNMSKLDNIALDWMNLNNRKVYAIFDSDDWYSSNYLEESLPYLCNNIISGKSDISFNYRNDVFRTLGSVKHDIWNPTLIGNLTDIRYDERITYCMDTEFLHSHRQKSYSIGYNESINNWIYNVTSNSFQQREDWKIWQAFTTYNTIVKNKDFKILKDKEVIWKYGDKIIEKQQDILKLY